MQPLSTSKNASQIEQVNPIALLKNPQKFKSLFFSLTPQISECIKNEEFEKAIKSLVKQLDMLELGKNLLKDIGKFWKICIYGNLACAYQGQCFKQKSSWKMQKCNKFCQKIGEELKRFLEETSQREEKMNLTKHYIKIKFQHCAILSQLNQHQKALEMCKETLTVLKKFIGNILQYTGTVMNTHHNKKATDTVHFSKQVCQLAEQILQKLTEFLNQPFDLNINKSSSFYYWQKNPQNNEQQIKKKYTLQKDHESCKRSILGVNKGVHWIDEFNIGTVMHIAEFQMDNFEKNPPIQEYLFKDKLYETVIFCSIAHFTIATQMRFIDSKRDSKDEKEGKEETDSKEERTFPNLSKIKKKYGYEEKSEVFKFSELYHLRAIKIIGENIKTTIPYLSHLIKSYEKHYIHKKELEPIQAIVEESAISVTQLNALKAKDFNYFEDDPYGSYSNEVQNVKQCQPDEEFLHDLQIQFKTSRIEKQSLKKEGCLSNMTPYYTSESKRENSSGKKNRSLGKVKSKRSKTKFKKEEEKKKKKGKKRKVKEHSEDKEVRIRHSSHTQIKLFFKKKK